jgi:hypothetical protein
MNRRDPSGVNRFPVLVLADCEGCCVGGMPPACPRVNGGCEGRANWP